MKIEKCKCGGKSRLKKRIMGIFKFVEIHCRCGIKTYGEYMWLSDEDRENCIKEWNELVKDKNNGRNSKNTK